MTSSSEEAAETSERVRDFLPDTMVQKPDLIAKIAAESRHQIQC